MQAPESPKPHTKNINHNRNTNENANPIPSQHAPSHHPSPTTSTPSPILTLFGTHDASNSGGSSPLNEIHHRRTHSDGSFRFAKDDIVGLSDELFNGFSAGGLEDMVSEEELFSVFLDLQNLGQNEEDSGPGCLMDQDDSGGVGGGNGEPEKISRVRQRNNSVLEGPGDGFEKKKAIAPEKLAEIWDVDPKRAKRILANRQSAARSKERKARYISELERKVHALQSEATNLSAQLTIYQRDTMGLTTENAELKLRLQAMDQQAQLRDALNEALKLEVERLKIASGELKTPSDSFSLGMRPPPYSPLASPSTLQPVQCSEPFSLGVRPYTPLASPSTLQPPVQCSPLASPSTLHHTVSSHSPVASPSALTLQTMSYSNPAASPSLRTTANLFPLPKKTVPVLAQLPPFHNSRSSLSSRRLRPLNPPPTLAEQQESLNLLQGLDISNGGSNQVKTEGHSVSGSESSSTTQMMSS